MDQKNPDADDTTGISAAPKEWYSRGYMPHRDASELLQCVTFRLIDSYPAQLLEELEKELAHLSGELHDQRRRARIEEELDKGRGCCALAHPLAAQTVQDSLLHFHEDRYQLYAWCIMPNHVHVLIQPQHSVSKIVQGWKSYTARQILAQNEELSLGIPDERHLWMREYWDRYIRDENHLANVIRYIHHNPVKAGLCRSPSEWPWSSAGVKGWKTGPG